MNRKDRRQLRAAVEQYYSTVMHAQDEFRNVIEDLKDQEEKKLDRLPESLQDSPLAEDIQEAVDQLDDTAGQMDDIIDSAIEEITDLLEISSAELKRS